ncbi:MAG: class I SAM-dependent methyltransferase [Myxococcales bacterium]
MPRFDAAYYERFYEDPRTRVHDAAGLRRRVDFVAAWLRYVGVTPRSILDLGCGPGLWRDELRRHFPRARYTGVEVSEHLCEKLGWNKGTVDGYRGAPADLVICNDVLQYLDDEGARRAIDNLARHTGQALVLQVLTRLDWEQNCDQSVTDGSVHRRTGAWYRRALGRHFRNCGNGLFLPKDSQAVLFELESL